MVTDCKVRLPADGGSQRGVVLSGADSPAAEAAVVWCRQDVVPPRDGSLVRIPGPVGLDVLSDLLGTGYAVEVFGSILPGQAF